MDNNEVVVLCIKNTLFKRGELNAMKRSWVAKRDRIGKCKYALAEFNGKVISVYEILETEKVKGCEKRVNLKLKKANRSVQKKYKNLDVSREKGCASPIRYFDEI